MALRIASFNMWGARGRERPTLADYSECWHQIGPDVVLLQEVVRSDEFDQLAEFTDALGYAHVAWRHGHATPAGVEGLAIASRVAFSDIRTHGLPRTEPPRLVLSALLELPSKARELRVATAHAIPDPRAAPGHLQAILGVARGALVLGADLNVEPDVVAPLLARANLADLAASAGLTWPTDARAFAAGWRGQTCRPPDFSLRKRRIDYLLGRQVRILSSGSDPLVDEKLGPASDHALIWADIDDES